MLGGSRGRGRLPPTLDRFRVGEGLAGHVIKQPQRAGAPRLRGQASDQPPCGRLGKFTNWLKVFLRRFFASQFKRSCMPDGPKVGSVSLSPRGDWRMPSDASVTAWLTEAETIPQSV